MTKKNKMPAAMILCGGRGTRIRDVTEVLPKPMVPIGPHPIVWHIMKTYAAFGVERFILCLGYKRDVFIDYFLNYKAHAQDVTINLAKKGDIKYHGTNGENWQVTLANTGENTMTGGRVAIGAEYIPSDEEDFFMTYGDGVANVDIKALYDFHLKQNKLLTITAVHPSGRFGEIKLEQGQIKSFYEKPQTAEGFINGGFMVINRKFVSEYLTTDTDLILEQQPMHQATKDEQMAAFVHNGFWQCMDTAREHKLLNDLWESGKAPWTKEW
ncbi:MAG: glucose-1-phosphate cytidylyltransferase [Sedimentisphaerales bacterium]|nr:glucose-1-phosphate cytidylyltransferase [Sedimentisphaerales bacterium]